MLEKHCSVCNTKMHAGLTDWHMECPKCAYQSADLKPAINENHAHINIDEKFRERGLRSLRIDNFKTLLAAIKETQKGTGTLLDVGCAHGWFLDIAKDGGFQVLGIEPDTNVFDKTAQRGLPVRKGFFPDVLSQNERFDVIVFNDVLEHIPDLNTLVEGCKSHLASEGVLVLNLPSSSGVIYRLSRLFSRAGYEVFFNRLWQKNLPSPHLHYFNSKNLQEFLKNKGFEPIVSGRLSTFRVRGLFTRISYTGNHPFFVRLIVYLLAAIALPVLLILPSDIIYVIAKRNDGC